MISLSIIAPKPVLSSSSILPPHSSHELSFLQGNFGARLKMQFQFLLFFSFVSEIA
jgi:hypothetical protein